MRFILGFNENQTDGGSAGWVGTYKIGQMQIGAVPGRAIKKKKTTLSSRNPQTVLFFIFLALLFGNDLKKGGGEKTKPYISFVFGFWDKPLVPLHSAHQGSLKW